MRTDFMPSKAQIKARKLFALRSKRGDFRKGKKSKKSGGAKASKPSKSISLSHMRRTGYVVKTKADYEKIKKQMKY